MLACMENKNVCVLSFDQSVLQVPAVKMSSSSSSSDRRKVEEEKSSGRRKMNIIKATDKSKKSINYATAQLRELSRRRGLVVVMQLTLPSPRMTTNCCARSVLLMLLLMLCCAVIPTCQGYRFSRTRWESYYSYLYWVTRNRGYLVIIFYVYWV